MNDQDPIPGFCTRCGLPGARIRRGLCNQCYKQELAMAKANGTYEPLRIQGTENRIRTYTTVNDAGCWIWTGHVNPVNGYGQIKIKNRGYLVHRVAYELYVGQIPVGFEVDHRCHSDSRTCTGGSTCPHRRCCNPAHLEAVPSKENNRRSSSPTSINGAKTHCIHGHEFTPENTRVTYVQSKNGPRAHRRCRECERARGRAYEERRRPRRRA